jgi:hypothetical protein
VVTINERLLNGFGTNRFIVGVHKRLPKMKSLEKYAKVWGVWSGDFEIEEKILK